MTDNNEAVAVSPSEIISVLELALSGLQHAKNGFTDERFGCVWEDMQNDLQKDIERVSNLLDKLK